MPPTPPDAAGQGRSTWLLAGLVAGALLLAHLGLGLLLTRGPRGAIAELRALRTAEQLETARDPGPQPQPSEPGFAAWTQARRLWEDATVLEERRGQVRALALGLSVSFGVQAGLVLLATLRAARRRA